MVVGGGLSFTRSLRRRNFLVFGSSSIDFNWRRARWSNKWRVELALPQTEMSYSLTASLGYISEIQVGLHDFHCYSQTYFTFTRKAYGLTNLQSMNLIFNIPNHVSDQDNQCVAQNSNSSQEIVITFFKN